MGALSAVTEREASHRRCAVLTDEDVGALRRAVDELASQCAGLRPGDAALVATELGTNLVRHATAGGYVLYRKVVGGIELLAVDDGPGMRHPGRPGPATALAEIAPGPVAPGSGLGVGLAAVENLATMFDLYSSVPGGTVVLARLLARPPEPRWCRWGGVNVPVDDDGVSGDAWAVAANGSLAALVVDGLGHGPDAAEASRAAIAVFEVGPHADLATFVGTAHEAMRGTRGGVLGICAIDPDHQEVRFAGVGNVAGRVLVGGGSQSLVGRQGTLGTHMPVPRTQEIRLRWEPGATLVLASDGLRTQWDPREYRGLLHHDPAVVAATLQRDHGRGTDDAAVLVVEDLRRNR